MKDGFIKVCAASPKVKVGDVFYNAEEIIGWVRNAEKNGAKLIVFPELCLTGSTAGDLFCQSTLIKAAEDAILKIAKATGDIIALVGMPISCGTKLYSAAAVIKSGEVIALIPNTRPKNTRVFAGGEVSCEVLLGDKYIPVTNKLIIRDASGMSVGAEFGGDIDAAIPESSKLAMAGANVIACLRSGAEYMDSGFSLAYAVLSTSKRLAAGYILANSGDGESTTDYVSGGSNYIAEAGEILAKGRGRVYSELDLHKIAYIRRKNTDPTESADGYLTVYTELKSTKTALTRTFTPYPWIKNDMMGVLDLQSRGLKKRLVHTGAKAAIIGISGGLDSTLALIATCKAFDLAGLDRKGILAITLPCFGTTDRTYNNAVSLIKELGASFMEIDIKDSVMSHFKDIGHNPDVTDVTYENSQARERTQVLMDIANKYSGIVVGTGDLSELALGWATYNGDHMSMYGVNAGVPKTAIRALLEQVADSSPDSLKLVLKDILDTPVSPELLPANEGEIAQKTEDLVGPYALHDFFIWHTLDSAPSPSKLLLIAETAFDGKFTRGEIVKWEKVFFKRFFGQQFKRSCLPDGVQVYEYSLSPRGGLEMPSDSSWSVWEKELEMLEKR